MKDKQREQERRDKTGRTGPSSNRTPSHIIIVHIICLCAFCSRVLFKTSKIKQYIMNKYENKILQHKYNNKL